MAIMENWCSRHWPLFVTNPGKQSIGCSVGKFKEMSASWLLNGISIWARTFWLGYPNEHSMNSSIGLMVYYAKWCFCYPIANLRNGLEGRIQAIWFHSLLRIFKDRLRGFGVVLLTFRPTPKPLKRSLKILKRLLNRTACILPLLLVFMPVWNRSSHYYYFFFFCNHSIKIIFFKQVSPSYLDEGCYQRTPLYIVLCGEDETRTSTFTRNLYIAKLLVEYGACVNYRIPITDGL